MPKPPKKSRYEKAATPGVIPKRSYTIKRAKPLSYFTSLLKSLPDGYNPNWIENIKSEPLKREVTKIYLTLLRESVDHHPDSAVRDLLARRLIWKDKLLQRVESALGEGVLAKGALSIRDRELVMLYVALGRQMIDCAKMLGVRGGKKGKVPSRVLKNVWREPVKVRDEDIDR